MATIVVMKCVIVGLCCSLCGEESRESGVETAAGAVDYYELSPRPGLLRGFHLLALIQDPHVAKEIALTGNQRDLLNGINRQYARDYTGLLNELRTVEQADQSKREILVAELNRKRDQLIERSGEQARAVLTKEQETRMREISVRLRGVEILFYRDVMDSLGLSAEQRQNIRSVREALVGDLVRLRRENQQNTSSGRNEKVAARFAEALENAIRVLTPNQQESFQQMRGKPIPFDIHDLKLQIRAKLADK